MTARRIMLICAFCATVHGHVYELIEPVDTVCSQPQYESVCDGFIYIWTKCDVLRAITTSERDRQAFSQLIVADVVHVANQALKLLKNDDVTHEQKQHLCALTQHLATAYDDAFAVSDNMKITCTQQILSMLKDMTDVNM